MVVVVVVVVLLRRGEGAGTDSTERSSLSDRLRFKISWSLTRSATDIEFAP